MILIWVFISACIFHLYKPSLFSGSCLMLLGLLGYIKSEHLLLINGRKKQYKKKQNLCNKPFVNPITKDLDLLYFWVFLGLKYFSPK